MRDLVILNDDEETEPDQLGSCPDCEEGCVGVCYERLAELHWQDFAFCIFGEGEGGDVCNEM